MEETWVQSLGQEDPLEKGMATHFSILAWRIPHTEEPGGLQSMGHNKSDTTEQLTLSPYGLSVNWTRSPVQSLGGDGTETLVSQPRCPISCWTGPFPKRVDGA